MIVLVFCQKTELWKIKMTSDPVFNIKIIISLSFSLNYRTSKERENMIKFNHLLSSSKSDQSKLSIIGRIKINEMSIQKNFEVLNMDFFNLVSVS